MHVLRVAMVLCVVAAAGTVPAATAGTGSAFDARLDQPRPQDEFVPIDELPPEEQLPAAPMVVAAYSFVWVAFVAYVFSLVKRVRKIEADLSALERRRR